MHTCSSEHGRFYKAINTKCVKNFNLLILNIIKLWCLIRLVHIVKKYHVAT